MILSVGILVGTLRKVMSGFTLPDGTELPTGTYIGTNVRDAVQHIWTFPARKSGRL